MMEYLILTGYVILGIIILFGIFRVLTKPYSGIFDLILDMLWLDLLVDCLGWIFENIGDICD